MADWYGVPLRRLLASADRLSESAIRRGSFSVNTPAFRSSALLFRVTSADHLWGLFLLREVWGPLFDRVLGFRDINDQPLCLTRLRCRGGFTIGARRAVATALNGQVSVRSAGHLSRSPRLSASAFEKLHRALMLFGLFSSIECAEISPLACLRIYFPRVETVSVGFKFSNHDWI